VERRDGSFPYFDWSDFEEEFRDRFLPVNAEADAINALEGTGYYQEKGKPIQIVHKGDVIKCLPGVEHWHGATPESGFTYIATTPTQKGKTIWLKRVTDVEYK